MATLPNAPCCQHRQETITEMQRSDLQEMLATAVRELQDATALRFADEAAAAVSFYVNGRPWAM